MVPTAGLHVGLRATRAALGYRSFPGPRGCCKKLACSLSLFRMGWEVAFCGRGPVLVAVALVKRASGLEPSQEQRRTLDVVVG